MSEQIQPGSEWRDNDPRMNGRVVVVERLDEHFVWYRRAVVLARSRRARFVKAFTRIDVPEPSSSADLAALRQEIEQRIGVCHCGRDFKWCPDCDLLRRCLAALGEEER